MLGNLVLRLPRWYEVVKVVRYIEFATFVAYLESRVASMLLIVVSLALSIRTLRESKAGKIVL